MKADPKGTPAERARALMGWKPRAQILADGGDITRRCERCRFRWLDRKRTHDERVDFASVCGHPDAAGDHGHATRESATCNHWEL